MKKQNQSSKLPSFRMIVEKRISANQNLLTSSKPEFGLEITNEEQRTSSTQSQIAKRIQSKIRLRKTTTGIQKQYSREGVERTNTFQKMEVQTENCEDFSVKIEQAWRSSQDIKAIIASYSSLVSPDEIKNRIQKEIGILQCQAVDHSLEELLITRVKRLCQLMASERRCGEHESFVSRLIQDRMRKLTDVLRTR